MTARTRARIFDVTGAVLAALLPSAAAAVRFPAVKARFGGGVTGFWHLSATAAVLAAVIVLLTAWRFIRHRLHVPQSGLTAALLFYVLFTALENVAADGRVIAFWAVVGCLLAKLCYLAADRLRGRYDT